MKIYADNAATTKMSRTAIDTMVKYMENTYGNPSSLYMIGQEAKEALEEARETVAKVINAEPREVLGRLFGEKKYVVEPPNYAAMANKYLIATTFHQRIKAGRCLYCGSPLYLNKCSECGHVWKI